MLSIKDYAYTEFYVTFFHCIIFSGLIIYSENINSFDKYVLLGNSAQYISISLLSDNTGFCYYKFCLEEHFSK